MMANGICKLTGSPGAFVKAHIIPKALTYKSDPAAPLIQGEIGARPIRRWDSWYDPALVTRAGEDILERYDTAALAELRRTKLVWHSWGPMRALSTSDHMKVQGVYSNSLSVQEFARHWGIRRISRVDTLLLRLFFLSVLWRAAASDLRDFRNIRLSASEMRRLRSMVRSESAHPLENFPIVLTQISTIGPVHNYGPVVERKLARPDQPNGPSNSIIRFYMDGLVAHIYPERSSIDTEELGPFVLGGSADELVVSTVTYEGSRQKMDLDTLVPSNYLAFPDAMRKLAPSNI